MPIKSIERTLIEPSDCLIYPANVEKGIYLGSDYHFPPTREGYALALQMLRSSIAQTDAKLLFLLGDIFDSKGIDTSGLVTTLLNTLSNEFPNKDFVFVAGNNDLRQDNGNPFDNFHFREDRIWFPCGNNPVVATIADQRILAANIFFDMRFLPYELLGYTEAELSEFYRSRPDGPYLFKSGLRGYESYTDKVAEHLDERVDILATHYLPHTVMVRWWANALARNVRDALEELGVRILGRTERDERLARKYEMSLEEFEKWRNDNSVFLGSPLLSHPAARLKNGLQVFYGHNHISERILLEIEHGVAECLSYQPIQK